MSTRLSSLRRSLVGAAVVLGLLGLAACGDAGESSDPAAAAGDRAAQEEAAFPVTIEHEFGSTTVEEEPERIVTVGFTDHDVLLALDMVPVGLRSWYGDHERGVWPWAEPLLGDAEPVLLGAEELNYEAIAALEPDLILGLYIGLEQTEYDLLSHRR